jgi:hypothetical protein
MRCITSEPVPVPHMIDNSPARKMMTVFAIIAPVRPRPTRLPPEKAGDERTDKHYAHIAPSYVASTIRAYFRALGWRSTRPNSTSERANSPVRVREPGRTEARVCALASIVQLGIAALAPPRKLLKRKALPWSAGLKFDGSAHPGRVRAVHGHHEPATRCHATVTIHTPSQS